MKITSLFAIFMFALNAILFAKPRLIITTDIGGDPDDSQSMVRLLLYANEFDIEGLIASASGTPGELDEAITRPDLIEERVRAYGEVLLNLQKHDKDYPGMEYLLDRVKSGNKFRGPDYIGAHHDTDGSNHIIAVVDKNDKRPVNIAIWGGQTDLAQALWRVRNDRTPEQLAAFVAKIRVYDIADQDGLFDWLYSNFPDLWYILNKAPEGVDKREAVFRGMYLGGDEDLTSKEWLRKNISRNHGPLGEAYPDSGLWTAPNPHGALKEGDTPSWIYFLPTGLSDVNSPEFGGWGGRFDCIENQLYRDAVDELDGEATARVTVWRWRPDFQHDFAARMDWCVNDFNDANHQPVAVVNGDNSMDVLVVNGTPGQTVELNAAGSSDPDGDALSFRWWIYDDISTYPETLILNDATSQKASINIPADFSDHIVHIICEVADDGEPGLTAYRRVLIIGDKYEYYIKKTLNEIKIDGVLEDEWSRAQEKRIEKPAGIEAPLTDLSGAWRALWDDNMLYLFVDIADGAPTLQKSAGLEHDAIHIYIDSDRDPTTATNNYHYEVTKLSSIIMERNNDALAGVEFKTSIADTRFTLELQIPWTTLKIDVTNDKFDIEIRALDYPDRNANLPEAAIAWYAAGAQNPFETGNLGAAFRGGLTVPDNVPPIVHVTQPADGAALTFGEPIAILAETFDADGVVNYVEFYTAANYLGRDRNDLDGWNLTWGDALPGTHDIFVRAFDDQGAQVTSESVRLVVFEPDAETVLMVTGDGLTPGERAVKQRFEQQLGFKVMVLDDDSVTIQDAEGKALLYFAESIGRNAIKQPFVDVVVPIICADPYLLADLNMTDSRVNTHFGITRSDYDKLTILSPEHQLAAGLEGSPAILRQPEKMVWGQPSDQAQLIAGVPDNAEQYGIFAYERRDQMVGSVAPSSRLGFFLSTNAAAQMNENGWALFEAAVYWAIEKHVTLVDNNTQPGDHVLIANYPNPFNPDTRFVVSLPETQHTGITIYDLLGRQVKIITHKPLSAGRHQFLWDATNERGDIVPSGVYLVQFNIGHLTYHKKITLLK